MKKVQLNRLMELRGLVFDTLDALFEDPYCCGKSSDGTFRVIEQFPPYWDRPDKTPLFVLEFSCYLLGPNRHYTWTGTDWDNVLDQAEQDIKFWIKEVEEYEY